MKIHPSTISQDHAQNLSSEKAEHSLPEELAVDYEVLSCLKYSDAAATYLARQKSSGKTVLLKTATDPLLAEALYNEQDLLEFIHRQSSRIADTFPVPLCLTRIQDTHYYIRTYIEGKTLEELCESSFRKPGLSSDQALDYIIHLTEVLHFLHNLKPPVIHRDIKPQNVVVDSNGACHFIDLGISRFFQKTKKSDTLIMGTRITAPPEQFGYQQTDFRSDLYSLGILLLYCLTGEYEVSDTSLGELEPAVRMIIRKATMFDPDKRYQTTEELLPDLIQARFPDSLEKHSGKFSRQQKRSWIMIGILLVLNLCLAVFLVLRSQKLNEMQTLLSETALTAEKNTPSPEIYQFQEPMIEEAVCQLLNLSPGTVTEADLSKVTELHIMGNQIYSDDSEIWFKGAYPWFYDQETRESGLYLQTGTIRSLEDITHMPNLVILSLYGQQISNISLLEGTGIKELGLGYNPLTDLTPLENNTSITYLNLATLDISNTEVISTLPNLQSLNISGTHILSLKGLENCQLKELNIFDQDLSDYRELRTLPFLTKLTLKYLNNSVLANIAGLPLKDLSVLNSSNLYLDSLAVLPDLEIFYCACDHNTYTKIDSPDLPNLRELDLVWTTLENFEGLASLPQLNTLKIYNTQCESYDGLDQIPNLHYIICTEQQYQEITAQYPENDFIFQY